MAHTELRSRRSTAFGYSSNVRLELIIDGRMIPLAKMGPERIVLVEATPLIPGVAEMVLFVDGQPRRWKIEILPHNVGDVGIPIRRLD